MSTDLGITPAVTFAKEVTNINIVDEMQNSYLTYAMSVIVGRALPDVRDGFKPVHRRILYAMYELNNHWNRSYKKSARIVGDVIGKYHPHGDAAVYDTIVRMAQTFSLRYPIVDGQGNFGSVDGDSPAAMRYTEMRMSKIAAEMLADIDKETVDFSANYDSSEHEPAVLPTRLPNLLINGSTGIAVGMATNIPPHNLSEIVNACLALLANPQLSIEDIIQIVPAPDFPTAGIIFGIKDIHQGYHTGRGRVLMRAVTHFEDIGKDRQAIIIDELPYQVNKAKLCERIADLVKEKLIEGISEIRDESDKSGMRVVIELRRAENSAVILNQLYKMTQMQESFGINMVALIKGQPRLLNLKEILVEFLKHRREVITRRTVFDLRKARERGHILEGLAVALSNVDEKISLIKAAASPALAKTQIMERVWDSPLVRALIARTAADSQTIQQSVPSTSAAESSITLDRSSADGYYLSAIQAQAILELRLQRLTALEQDKIIQEYTQIVNIIADLQDILNTPARVDDIISTELTDIKCQFGDARRSRIEQHGAEIDDESLIIPRDLVVTLSHTGYIKTQSADEYRTQKRGGRGKSATANKEDDFVQTLFIAHTHDYILCFSTLGRMYWLKVYNLPEGSRGARGKPIVNLLNLQDGETITAILPVKNFTDNLFVFMATALGTVKKVALSAFSHPSARGIIAINLDEGDKLAGVALTDGSQEIMLFSDGGKAVRFNESHVRDTGRSSRGVRGMKLGTNCKIVALLATADMEASVLTATENGYGKRTGISAYRLAARSTQGVKAIGESLRNGKLVAAKLVNDNDELILITDGGTLIRTRVSDIREIGRSSMGVKLINLNVGEKLVDIERVLETIDNIDDTDNRDYTGILMTNNSDKTDIIEPI